MAAGSGRRSQAAAASTPSARPRGYVKGQGQGIGMSKHTCTHTRPTCTRRVAGFHTGVSRSHSCLTAAANAGHDVCITERGKGGIGAIKGMNETKRGEEGVRRQIGATYGLHRGYIGREMGTHLEGGRQLARVHVEEHRAERTQLHAKWAEGGGRRRKKERGGGGRGRGRPEGKK